MHVSKNDYESGEKGEFDTVKRKEKKTTVNNDG